MTSKHVVTCEIGGVSLPVAVCGTLFEADKLAARLREATRRYAKHAPLYTEGDRLKATAKYAVHSVPLVDMNKTPTDEIDERLGVGALRRAMKLGGTKMSND